MAEVKAKVNPDEDMFTREELIAIKVTMQFMQEKFYYLNQDKDTKTYNVDSTNGTAPIDVLDVFIRETVSNETTDIPMSRLSRAEYAHITTKSTTGKPNQFFINKQLTPTISVWPTPDKSSTYTIHMNVLVRMDDAAAGAHTLDLPFRFYPCLAAGLAYYISMKRAPERTAALKAIYEDEFQRALSQDEDRASFRIAPSLRNYNNA